MGLYDRIKEAASKKGYSINRLEKELQFPRSSISKFNKNIPSMEKVKKIAELLDVSIDELTGEESQQEYYLNEETAKKAQEMYEDSDMRTLFDMKRKMPADRFSAHVKFMKELYEKENPSE